MNDKYTGEVRGFQVITTLESNITLHPTLANDLNAILNNLYKIYNVERLKDLETTFANHSSNQGDAHSIEIPLLGSDMLKDLYKEWLKDNNSGTLDYFTHLLFEGTKVAVTDEEIYGMSTDHGLTVANFFKALRAYHLGAVYAHPPILDQMFIGDPVVRVPIFNYEQQDDLKTILIDPDEREHRVCAKHGTFVLDIDPVASQESEYFFTAYEGVPTAWAGFISMPNAVTPVASEPAISLFRHRTVLSKIVFRLSMGGIVDQVTMDIDADHSSVVITYDDEFIVCGYKNDNDISIIKSVSRKTVGDIEILAYQLSKVKTLTYYMKTFNSEQLSFLLT